MLWIAAGITALVSVTALVSYLFGKYWLGFAKFKVHLGSIEWSVAAKWDVWHWRICLNAWYDGAPGFHFDSTGFEFGIGPLFFRAMGKDTN